MTGRSRPRRRVERCDLLRRRVLAEHDRDRVAGDDVDHGEHPERRDQHDRYDLDQTAKDVRDHFVSTTMPTLT